MIKFLKGCCYTIFAIFLLISLILQTDIVRDNAKNYVINHVKEKTGYDLTIEDVTLFPSLQFIAKGVSLKDGEQEILHSDTISTFILPSVSDRDTIELYRLTIQGLTITKPKPRFDISGYIVFNISELSANGDLTIDRQDQNDQTINLTFDHKPEGGQLSAKSRNGQYAHGDYIILDDLSIQFSSLEASYEPFTINGDLKVNSTGNIIDSTLYLQSSDLSSILPAEGKLQGQAKIRGSIASPQVDVVVQSGSLNLYDERLEDIMFRLMTREENNNLKGEFELQFTKEGFPYTFSSDLSWDPSLGPIPHKLSTKTDLRELTQLLDIDITQAEGTVTLNLEYANKTLEIEAILVDGLFESYEYGTLLKNARAIIRGDQKRINLISFTAVDDKGGTLDAAGWVNLNKTESFPYSFTFMLKKANLIQLDNKKAALSGTINVAGNALETKVSGDLQTDSIRIDLPSKSSKIVEGVAITYINQPNEEESPTTIVKTPHDRTLNYDVKITIPGDAKIKGNNLSTNWRGALQVRGSSKALEVYGDLKLYEGRYIFRGKTLDLVEGVLTFSGDPKKKTTVYVIAELSLDRMTVEAITKGPVGKTTITLRSNPPMPQREILSRLLFNRSAGEITPLEGSRLNQSLLTLSDTNDEGPDIITKLSNTLGLDRIEIGQRSGDPNEKVSVQLGKYIADGTYISISRNVNYDPNNPSEPNCVGGIETELGKNFKAQIEVDDRANGQLNLLWKRDY